MMPLRRIFAPSALLLAAIVAGCGADPDSTPFSPDSSLTLPRIVAFEPVPTDLVIAIDVSDSTDAGELTAILDALMETLDDASVFDLDGTVALAILVYGDTTDVVVGPLTTLDAGTLATVVQPALAGLVTDRRVSGASAVLDEALDAAAALLAASSSGNAHLVVIGGGQDVDPLVVADRCTDLASSGISFHAVGLAASQTAEDMFTDCTGATGGSFVDAPNAAAIAGAVSTVLARVTVVQLELLPDTAERDRGTGHTVTARVTRGTGDSALALADLYVAFSVTAGPSAGASDSVLTDAMGEASFSLSGDVPPGTDTIVARVAHPDGDVVLDTSVEVTWLNQAPECAAGGPYEVTVDGESAQVILDASAIIDPDGDPLSFAWSVSGDGLTLVDADSSVATLIITGEATCADTIEVELAISDGFDTTTCVVQVVLDDRRPPVIVAREPTLELWPPNHTMHVITPGMVLDRIENACGSFGLEDIVVLSVTSDEAFDARGSGRTSPDIVVGCDGTVELRAERSGGGDGRVYTIEYAVFAEDGESATLMVEVHVPHDSSGRRAIAGSVAETVMADCDGQAR